MKRVSTAFSVDIDHAAACRPELGRIGRRLNREFLYRFGRKAHDLARNADAGIVDPVGQHDRAAGPATIYAQVKSRNRKIRRHARILASGNSAHVGRCERKVEHTPIYQWKILHLTLCDGLSRSAALDVEKRGVLLNRHGCIHRARTQLYIAVYHRSRVHLDCFDYGLSKPGRLNLNAIRNRVEVISRVRAGVRGL